MIVNGRKLAATTALMMAFALIVASCGEASEEEASSENTSENSSETMTIAVTTDILGDVVENLVSDQFVVEIIMPSGVDPHLFQPSAQQVAALTEADLVITNGGSFEEGLLDVIEDNEADTPTLEVLDLVNPIEFAGDDEHSDDEHSDDEHSDDEHSDDEHSDEEEHSEEDDHDHSGVDPHFFNDPARMVLAAKAIVDFIENETEVELTEADGYITELENLDIDVEDTLSVVPDENRVLVTNHEVFGYFAERYNFEVLGVVVEGGNTANSTSSADLAELATKIEESGVKAIFTDLTADDDLVETLTSEVEGLQVGELFSESLGAEGSLAEDYISMANTNAERIANLLAENE